LGVFGFGAITRRSGSSSSCIHFVTVRQLNLACRTIADALLPADCNALTRLNTSAKRALRPLETNCRYSTKGGRDLGLRLGIRRR
jgi:hypothetical protein